MQEAEIKKTLHWLWLLPIFAMLIALYLAYKSISNLGPEITIELASANGLEAGRTKIRYRSLEVGTVKDITLTPDFQRVIIHAQMKKMAEPLLKADSEFWVVSPQIGFTGIKGLNTLLSGNFIEISPGKSLTYSKKFQGLDEIPAMAKSIFDGIRVFLEAETNAGLNVGSAIYYRGFVVGRIVSLKLSADFSKTEVQAFIKAPYDKLINSKTKFYNVSGLDLKVGMSGVEINMPSLETVLLGGLSFTTEEKSNEFFDPDRIVFKVYKSQQEIIEKPVYKKANYAMRFDNSIRGLRIGSLVEFQGIELGRVSDIKLIYDDDKNLALNSVILELEFERMKAANKPVDENSFSKLIKNGLYATLETANFFSGEKLIRLNINPNNSQELFYCEYSNYPLIPSQDSGFDFMVNQGNEILAKVKNLPLDELIASANSAVQSLEKVAKDLEGTGKNLNKSLNSVSRAANSVEKMMNNLNKEIPSVSRQFKHTMQSIDSESNIYFKFNKTLEDLSRMAQGISRLMRQLDAKPNSMIFGK